MNFLLKISSTTSLKLFAISSFKALFSKYKIMVVVPVFPKVFVGSFTIAFRLKYFKIISLVFIKSFELVLSKIDIGTIIAPMPLSFKICFALSIKKHSIELFVG